jgi:hypothetical protein
MRRLGFILLLIVPVALTQPAALLAKGGAQTLPAPPPQRLPRPVSEIERALLISIDGCRPDLLLRADAPNIRKLMKSGSYHFWARTIPAAITLPSHASMLTGVVPEKHGITFNTDQGDDNDSARPKVPTIFEIAQKYDVSNALVAGKAKFDTFGQIGHVGRAWIKDATDEEVASAAVQMIRDYRPELLFVHFPGNDRAGHKLGWAAPEQIAAIENIDKQFGKVLAQLDEEKLRDETVIIVTADHGGAGRGHGISGGGAPPDDPRSQHIPWIINGPGIRKDYDLSQDPRLTLRTMDTFATLCWLLGMQPDGAIDGKPIKLALQQRGELLESK